MSNVTFSRVAFISPVHEVWSFMVWNVPSVCTGSSVCGSSQYGAITSDSNSAVGVHHHPVGATTTRILLIRVQLLIGFCDI